MNITALAQRHWEPLLQKFPLDEVLGIRREDLRLQDKFHITDYVDERTFLLTLWALVALFLLLSVLQLLVVVQRRREYLALQKEAAELRGSYQDILAEMVDDAYQEEADLIFRAKWMPRLFDMDSSFERRIFLQELMLLYKNVDGKALERLRDIFVKKKYSDNVRHNLQSRKWYIRTKAIKEAGEVRLYEFLPDIEASLYHRNDQIATAAMVAHTQLSTKPLAFLDNYPKKLNEWQQHLLQRSLSQMALENLPDFKQWLHSSNVSVQCFAIKMAGLFNQFDAQPDIIALLDHPVPEVQVSAVRALPLIGTEAAILALERRYANAEGKLRTEILKSLKLLNKGLSASYFGQQVDLSPDDLRLAEGAG